jgi:hypothetical protein
MLQRNWFGRVKGVYHRVMLWAPDDFLALLKYEGHTFFDATFWVVPAPFAQCFIVMVYDAGTNVFVPCVYCLMTAKLKHLYCIALHEIITLLDYHWTPRAITVDFEKALIAAVKYKFQHSPIVGCFFHFMQAIRRKMKKFHVPEDDATALCRRFELLTVIPHSEIDLGIEYICEVTGTDGDNWAPFWSYFKNTWIKSFPVPLWNISLVNENHLAGRTNNALERYNRRFGEKFGAAHPNISAFIQVTRSEFQYFAQLHKNIVNDLDQNCDEFHDFTRASISGEFVQWKNARK